MTESDRAAHSGLCRRAARKGKSAEFSNRTFDARLSRRLILPALLAILVLAAWQRLDNLAVWNASPDRFFHDGLPLLMNVDGYYYLDLARSLDESSYRPIDPDRVVPEGRPRPSPPPLLSLLTTALKWVTGARLEWIAVLLPAVVAGFIAFPLYGLGTVLAGRSGGLVAALFGATAPFYAARTTLGWYDTDCVNITLILTIAWLVIRYSEVPDRRGYRWLAAAAVAWIALLTWWDTAIVPATLSFVAPMTIAVFVRYPWPRCLAALGVLVIASMLVVSAWSDVKWIDSMLGLFRYIGEGSSGRFPHAAGNVIEQSDWGIADVARIATGSLFGLVAAVVGLGIAAMTRCRRLLFLAFPIAVACLSLQAARFILFLAPVAALGSGVLVHWLHSIPPRPLLRTAVAVGAASILAVPHFAAFRNDDSLFPARQPYHAEVLSDAQRFTEQNAVIWADWGHGYPILYYARRGQMADGSNHSGTALYFLNAPLAAGEPRLAANWMRFMTVRGVAGLENYIQRTGNDPGAAMARLRTLLGAGPRAADELLRSLGTADTDARARDIAFLFPPASRPIYLLLDFQKIQSPWFRYGNWDFAAGDGPGFAHVPFAGLRRDGDRIFGPHVEIDAAQGKVRYGGRTHSLARLTVVRHGDDRTPVSVGERDYGTERLRFEFDPTKGTGILYSENVIDSVGHRLFAGKGVEGDYFRPLLVRDPWYRLFRVVPDPPPS